MEKKTPIRTCVACKTARPKKELVRIVKTEEGIFLDKTGKRNGRGAYVCNDINCVNKLKDKKILNRVFSMEVSNDTYEKIAEEFLGKE